MNTVGLCLIPYLVFGLIYWPERHKDTSGFVLLAYLAFSILGSLITLTGCFIAKVIA